MTHTVDDLFFKVNNNDEWTLMRLADKSIAKTDLNVPAQLWQKRVTNIAHNAFLRDNVVEKVQIPNTIVKIGGRAFYDCVRLQYLFFQRGTQLLEVRDSAFEWDGSLITLSCLRPVSLGKLAFANCKNLQLAEGYFTKIEEDAFANCENLKTVVFKSRGCDVHDNAFDACTNIKTLRIEEDFNCSDIFVQKFMYDKHIQCKKNSCFTELAFHGVDVEIIK